MTRHEFRATAMKKGYIYVGTIAEKRKKNTIHPIICLENTQSGTQNFNACIVSTDGPGQGRDNIPMKKEHFEKKDANGNLYKFQYKNTHLIKRNYSKDVVWINPIPIGQLSSSGIDFVDNYTQTFGQVIHSSKPIWEE